MAATSKLNWNNFVPSSHWPSVTSARAHPSFPLPGHKLTLWLSCVRCLCVTLSWIPTSPSACDVNVWSLIQFRFSCYRFCFNLCLISDNTASSYWVTRNICGNPAKPRKSFLYCSLDLFCLVKTNNFAQIDSPFNKKNTSSLEYYKSLVYFNFHNNEGSGKGTPVQLAISWINRGYLCSCYCIPPLLKKRWEKCVLFRFYCINYASVFINTQ